jgi:glycosyltransferase XagB
LQQSQS